MIKVILFLLIAIPVWATTGLVSNYCEVFYLAHDMNQISVMPILNVDRTKSFIENLPRRHQNELSVKTIGLAEGEPIYRLDLPSHNPDAQKVLITSGVHGNEPFGVTATLEVIEKLLYDRSLRSQYHFVFFPMINPAGLKRGLRRTLNNQDINRSFKAGKETQVVRMLKEELRGEKFDLGLDLHGARFKSGFFVIKANQNDAGLASRALREMDPSSIITSPTGNYPYNIPMTSNPNRTAYVLTSPGETTSFNPGTVKAFFNRTLGIRQSYTLEYPGQLETFRRQNDFVSLVMGFIINK